MDEDWAGAVERFAAAFKRDPNFCAALYNLALATEKNDEIKKARKLYEQYLELAEAVPDQRDDVEKVKAHLAELNQTPEA